MTQLTRQNSFFNMDLEGLEPLEKKLQDLPGRVRNKALRKSLNAGTEIVLDEAIRLAPKSAPAAGWMAFLVDESDEHLKDNIVKKVTVTKKYAWGRVGIDYLKVRHGHLVEFGTRPHQFRIGGVTYSHPGGRAIPFMRPAFDAKGDAAVDVMANMLYDAVMGEFSR